MKNTIKKQPNGYWENYENNYNEAKKYKSRKEFQKGCSGAYHVALKKSWLDNYTWFISRNELQKINQTKWTYETCYQEAKKYNSRKEFQKGCSSAYNVARKKGWLDKYTWFAEKKKRNYWNYETCYQEALKYNSRIEFQKGCSSAYHVARKNGWLDNYIWFKKDLDPYKNKRDNVYCYIYIEFNAIYIGRTIDIDRRHKEHNTDENSTVYKFAKQNNVPIPQITTLEKNLSLEEGLEKENFYVNKYQKEGWKVLNKAKTGKNCGSLGSLSNGKWTYETCYQEALKYKSKSEFAKNSSGAYQIARQNGWLDNYTWFEEKQKPSGYWEIYENNYNEALKYKSRIEFAKNSSSAYQAACKKGWLDNYTWFEEKQKPSGYWTYETCYQEAKKYKSRIEFKKGSYGAYQIACKNSWLDNYTWFSISKTSKKWNYETCYQEAQKYNSRKEFQKGCSSAYNVARKNCWLDNYTWFEEKQKPSGYWTYETCYQEAKKYKSRKEFQKGCSSAYNVAYKKGWLDRFFPKA